MAHLRALTLSHFRSHKSVQLMVDARPIALFGANGAGKTNVLEAISLLSPGRGLRRAAPEEFGRQPEGIGWKIKAELESFGQIHELEVTAAPEGPRQVQIDGKTAPQSALAGLARILWLVPSMDRLWLDGAAERRRFLDRLAMSFEPSHAGSSLSYEKAMRQRNRLLKDQIRDQSWYVGLETQMARHGADIHRNRAHTLTRLLAAQSNAATIFPHADLVLEEVSDAVSADDLAVALSESRPRDIAAGRSLIGPHRTELLASFAAKGTPARLSSTGEQKALLISIILANARALAEDLGQPPILLLDEIAAHLDSKRRACLYEEISSLKAQAWMTGTGEELFSDLGAGAAMYKISETDNGSRLEHFA